MNLIQQIEQVILIKKAYNIDNNKQAFSNPHPFYSINLTIIAFQGTISLFLAAVLV